MLTNPLFTGNPRFLRAAENAPPMRRGEPDHDAVRILQNALIGVGVATMRRSIRPDGTLDGDYGSETVQAVRRFQERFGLTGTSQHGDGIVGRLTMRELDVRAPRQLVPVVLAGGPAPTPKAETPATLETPSTARRPTAEEMLREYRKFRDVRGKPCAQGIKNQCAIRMSVALMRCDIGFYFDKSKIEYMHSSTNPRCRTGVAHNASSSRLFPYLQRFWTFRHYDKRGVHGRGAAEIMAELKERPGIIYFVDCFEGGPNVGGDHIDFWDGRLVMNDMLNYNGPGERDPDTSSVSSARWFRNAKRHIWFLSIPKS